MHLPSAGLYVIKLFFICSVLVLLLIQPNIIHKLKTVILWFSSGDLTSDWACCFASLLSLVWNRLKLPTSCYCLTFVCSSHTVLGPVSALVQFHPVQVLILKLLPSYLMISFSKHCYCSLPGHWFNFLWQILVRLYRETVLRKDL